MSVDAQVIDGESFFNSPFRRFVAVMAAAAILLAVVYISLQARSTAGLALSKEKAAAGMAAYKKGAFAKAAASLQEAVKLNPKNAKAQSALGQSYEATGKLDRAAKAYQDSLAVDANQPEVMYNLAIIHKAQNKNKEAITELEKAIKLNQKFVAARLILGDLYALQNQKDKAGVQYQAVLEMKPFGTDLAEIKRKLEGLK